MRGFDLVQSLVCFHRFTSAVVICKVLYTCMIQAIFIATVAFNCRLVCKNCSLNNSELTEQLRTTYHYARNFHKAYRKILTNVQVLNMDSNRKILAVILVTDCACIVEPKYSQCGNTGIARKSNRNCKLTRHAREIRRSAQSRLFHHDCRMRLHGGSIL